MQAVRGWERAGQAAWQGEGRGKCRHEGGGVGDDGRLSPFGGLWFWRVEVCDLLLQAVLVCCACILGGGLKCLLWACFLFMLGQSRNVLAGGVHS